MVLGITFLSLAVILDSCWALTAGWASGALKRFHNVQNRIIGALYITTAAGLAVMRRNPS